MATPFAVTFPHNYTSPLQRCVIRVDDTWYDLTAWRHTHPGGVEIIDKFNGIDATEAFYAVHSKEAIEKLLRMKGKKAESAARDEVSVRFRSFREKLRREGWFDRNWTTDFFYYMLPCILLVLFGTIAASTYPLLATLAIGVAMQQAGWLGHDYQHGRGTGSFFVGSLFAQIINGFSSRWWSQKHNTHHIFPNRKEHDSDIHNEPILHLWFPAEGRDVPFRKYQHIYYPLAYSFLYVSWRMQSIMFVLGSRDWVERVLMAVGYIWLAFLPWKVAVGSVFVGGFLVAIIVTSNHQTEEILEPDAPYNFVVDQFTTTRGVVCSDPITEYLFGGMQYQLEHHLFPTMPKANFAKVRPLVKRFAEENNLQFHVSGVVEILRMNRDVMKKYAMSGASK